MAYLVFWLANYFDRDSAVGVLVHVFFKGNGVLCYLVAAFLTTLLARSPYFCLYMIVYDGGRCISVCICLYMMGGCTDVLMMAAGNSMRAHH